MKPLKKRIEMKTLLLFIANSFSRRRLRHYWSSSVGFRRLHPSSAEGAISPSTPSTPSSSLSSSFYPTTCSRDPRCWGDWRRLGRWQSRPCLVHVLKKQSYIVYMCIWAHIYWTFLTKYIGYALHTLALLAPPLPLLAIEEGGRMSRLPLWAPTCLPLKA